MYLEQHRLQVDSMRSVSYTHLLFVSDVFSVSEETSENGRMSASFELVEGTGSQISKSVPQKSALETAGSCSAVCFTSCILSASPATLDFLDIEVPPLS